jgi:predicted nucleic acid-binding protein
MTRWLLDTGPLVAALDADDSEHPACRDALLDFTGQLHTTDAVVVEAMHFLNRVPSGAERLVEFLVQSRTEIRPFVELTQLGRATQLMRKYADVPMDFTDATLVLLAQELAVPEVLTLDRRGFNTFRFGGQKRFQLVLDR